MIPLFKVFMSPEAGQKVNEVLYSEMIGQGPINQQFENSLRIKLGNEYINTTNSATAAEHLAFQMLKLPYPKIGWKGIGQDDEVLTISLTCFATHIGPLANGLKVKFVDVDPDTLNIDLDDLERKISPKTKAINVVHWGGDPVDLDRLKEIQSKTKELFGFKPAIVEDAAHALGSKYKGKYIGSHGNLTTFSFQAIKTITCGDGGALACPNADMYFRSRKLRWFGIDRDDPTKVISRCDGDINEAGHKFHMNDINSAIGLANLEHLNEIIYKHRENAKYYDEQLKNVSGIKLLKRNIGHDSSFWLYSILVEDKESFTKKMHENGIMVNHAHQRTDQHSCMFDFRCHLPNLDKIMPKMTNLPVGWWVTAEDREFIVSKIKEGW